MANRYTRPTLASFYWRSAVSVYQRGVLFQAVGLFRVESGPTQAVLPLVGLAAEKVIRDRYT
ncbi:MAG: hypothetical protein ACQESR_14950 [Planctomycetota bacterium]